MRNNPRTMTLLGNYLEDHPWLQYIKGTSSGDGSEGDLIHVIRISRDGATLPSEVTFYFGLAGTSMDPELLNVYVDFL